MGSLGAYGRLIGAGWMLARNDVLLRMRDGRSASPTDNTFLTSYAYDTKGNQTTVTDPLGRVTTTSYTDGTTVAAEGGGFAPAGLPRLLVTPGGALIVVRFVSMNVRLSRAVSPGTIAQRRMAPVSATITSPAIPACSMANCALRIHVPRVSASLRHGITTESSMSGRAATGNDMQRDFGSLQFVVGRNRGWP